MRNALLLAALPVAALGFAQSGTNFDCAHAIPLAVSPTNVQQTLIPADGKLLPTAVPDPVTACSGGGNITSAWFSFTVTAVKQWVRTDGDGTDDASIEVFSGSCGSLASVGCFAANSATPSLTGLAVGSTYYVRVMMANTAFCLANTQLCQVWLAVVSAPPNDDCSGAIELPVVAGAVMAYPATEISSLGATQSQAACFGNQAASNDDVWYRFTATHASHFLPINGLYNGVQEDLVFEWFSGTCGSLTSIGCSAGLMTTLAPGTQYFIRAHTESIAADVTLRALVDVFAPSPIDECAAALPIEVVQAGDPPKPVSISTINATSSTVPCGTQPRDVWLTFIAPGTSVVVAAEGVEHAGLYSGSCGSLVCVVQGGLSSFYTYTGLTAGATYYLKLGAQLSPRNGRVWMYAPALNDECVTAEDVTVQSDPVAFTLGHTYNAQQEAWYRFTAIATRALVEGYSPSGTSGFSATVYSGACGSLVSLDQQDLGTPLVMTGLVVGQQYHVRLGANGIRVPFRFAVRTPLVNDECDGAIALPFSTVEDFITIPRTMSTLAANGTGGCLPTRDVWYRFTAAHSSAGFLGIIDGATAGNVTVELFGGACGSLTSLGCTSAVWSVKTKFTGLTVGTEYRIRLSAFIITPFTPMLFDQPANDEIGGALPAPFSSTFAQALTQQWNFGSTQSMAVSCAGSTPDEDTWYSFLATDTEHSITALSGNEYFNEGVPQVSFKVEVYDTLSTDPAVLADNLISCGTSPRALTGLIVGNDYLYRVFTTSTGPVGTYGFHTSVAAANNDEATDAMPLTYGTDYAALLNTTGATQSLPGSDCQVDDFADDDIWFKFAATAAPARVVVGYHTADVTIELFSGTPGNLTSIACDGNILELPTLTTGQAYYVRVYSWKNNTPVSGRIGLFTTPSLTANSCVDETCLGPVLVPNPGIEQGAYCLTPISEISALAGLGTQVAPGWPRMQEGSSDGMSSCSNHDRTAEVPTRGPTSGQHRVLSRSGKGMGGIFLKDAGGIEYTEYLQASLADPLVPGQAYLVSFHVATHAEALCLSGIGAVLSEGPIPWGYYAPMPVEPDVISLDIVQGAEWVNICGVVVPNSPVDNITIGLFQAQGAVSYIGNFVTPSYYYIDDVVVALIDDPGCITSIGDVPPLEERTDGAGDDLRVYPNPANERVHVVGDASLFGQRAVIEVFDATGSRVHAEQVGAFGALQTLDLSREWKEGLYLVMVRVEGQPPRAARMVIKR